MAKFYDVPIRWLKGAETKGRGIGNNAGWICKCGEVMLGPYQYKIPDCPNPECQRQFLIVRGQRPQFVDHVKEVRKT
jgi:hypothetical protein